MVLRRSTTRCTRGRVHLVPERQQTFPRPSPAARLTRVTTGEIAEEIDDGLVNPVGREGIGRIAIKRTPPALPKLPDIMSPSMLGPGIAETTLKNVTVHRYAQPIIVPPGLFSDAAEQGTVLHHCVRTLVLRPDLSEPLISRASSAVISCL